MTSKAIASHQRDIAHASSYREWREIAQELDRLEGLEAWKLDEASGDYDYRLIRERLAHLRRLRQAGDLRELSFDLQAGLHGNFGDIANPALHARARVGTKRLIEEYIEEVARCLEYVCQTPSPSFSNADKIVFFQRTGASFGRSALLLSGGATLGMFHLGVIKALWEENLLPRVLTGSSAGSLIASMVGSRLDHELGALFEPKGLATCAFQRMSLRRAIEARALLDSRPLARCIAQNVGDYTFQEAFERTGRIVGITVSPSEPHQHGRLLNYLTAPHVLMTSAILASCAVPGVYAPVMLQARSFDRQVVPYLPTARWVDGTASADLPMLRLARLHNVNHYIVSQTNPHIVPFMRSDRAPRRGLIPFTRELVSTTSRSMVRLMREHLDPYGFARMADRLNGVIAQNYAGDINIFPRHTPRQLMRMFVNPSAEDMAQFIRDGERATWPQIERIRSQTRISRTLESCLLRLKDQERALRDRDRPVPMPASRPALRAAG